MPNLLGRCQPFTRLLKNKTRFIWDQAYQNAFKIIKQYLTMPPVLMALVQRKPLILYATTLKRSLGAMLIPFKKGKKMSCTISTKQW